MEDRKIWFDRVLSETGKIVLQTSMVELRKHPLLRDEMDDLVQETYMELFKKYDSLCDHKNIPGWLIETLRRKTKDRAKRLYKEIKNIAVQIDSNEAFSSTFSDYTDIPEDSYIQQEKSEELRSAISMDLGEDAYRLLEAHYVYKIPLSALAEDNGLTIGALKMKFHRWKKRIRAKKKIFFE